MKSLTDVDEIVTVRESFSKMEAEFHRLLNAGNHAAAAALAPKLERAREEVLRKGGGLLPRHKDH